MYLVRLTHCLGFGDEIVWFSNYGEGANAWPECWRGLKLSAKEVLGEWRAKPMVWWENCVECAAGLISVPCFCGDMPEPPTGLGLRAELRPSRNGNNYSSTGTNLSLPYFVKNYGFL